MLEGRDDGSFEMEGFSEGMLDGDEEGWLDGSLETEGFSEGTADG